MRRGAVKIFHKARLSKLRGYLYVGFEANLYITPDSSFEDVRQISSSGSATGGNRRN